MRWTKGFGLAYFCFFGRIRIKIDNFAWPKNRDRLLALRWSIGRCVFGGRQRNSRKVMMDPLNLNPLSISHRRRVSSVTSLKVTLACFEILYSAASRRSSGGIELLKMLHADGAARTTSQ
ncbi:hypothetical protein HN51_060158 [Arachis hypogaea]